VISFDVLVCLSRPPYASSSPTILRFAVSPKLLIATPHNAPLFALPLTMVTPMVIVLTII